MNMTEASLGRLVRLFLLWDQMPHPNNFPTGAHLTNPSVSMDNTVITSAKQLAAAPVEKPLESAASFLNIRLQLTFVHPTSPTTDAHPDPRSSIRLTHPDGFDDRRPVSKENGDSSTVWGSLEALRHAEEVGASFCPSISAKCRAFLTRPLTLQCPSLRAAFEVSSFLLQLPRRTWNWSRQRVPHAHPTNHGIFS